MFIKSLKVEDPTSFRLITINPGPNGSQLCLTISDASFKKAQYFCLSYTWNPHGPAHEILVNDKQIIIGHNLWLFLCSARSAALDKLLWVDALCIDQSNLRERNQVVSRMGDIYANAERVIIWLGEQKRSLARFFAELKRTEDLLLNHPQRRDRRAAISAKLESLNKHARSVWEKNAVDALSLPYFERLWVAQEILLADTSHVWLDGSNSLDMDSFAELMVVILSQKSQDALAHMAESPGYKYVWWHYTTSQESRVIQGPIDLASLLPRFAESRCQLSVDRIYALLSLATNGDKFQVDYSIDAATLFARTLEFSMDGRPLDDLLLVGANLLELLQLLPPDPNPDYGAIEIESPMSAAVSQPIYRTARLCTEADTILALPTVSIAIHESTNLHLFEYAYDPITSTPPRITHCRAHEYVHGTPTLPAAPGTVHDKAYYIYTTSPSESVHYFSRTPTAATLHSWTSPPLALPNDPPRTPTTNSSSSSHTTAQPHLTPSTRSVKLGVVWDAYFARETSRVFGAASREVAHAAWTQLQPSERASNALAPRRNGQGACGGGRGGDGNGKLQSQGGMAKAPPTARATGVRVVRGAFDVRRIVCVRKPKQEEHAGVLRTVKHEDRKKRSF